MEKGNCLSAVVKQQQSYEITQHHSIDILLDNQMSRMKLCARYIYKTVPYPGMNEWWRRHWLEVVNSGLHTERTTPYILQRTYNLPRRMNEIRHFINTRRYWIDWLLLCFGKKKFFCANLFNDIKRLTFVHNLNLFIFL